MALSMDKLFVREFERKNGDVLIINQCEIGDVGCVVWDAALVLSSFLETAHFRELCDGEFSRKTAIELGAGTGIVGLQAACQGLDCIITDLADCLPLMSLNIERNRHLCRGEIKAATLRWGEDNGLFQSPDILLLADCVYYEEAVEPLVESIQNLSHQDTRVLCCYEERTVGNKVELQNRFFELINRDFDVTEIPLEKQDPFYRSDDIHLFLFRRKAQS